MKGRAFKSEFIPFRDEETGAEIIQLTSFPTVNTHPYFHANSFTPDSRALIFHSLSEAKRESGIDVFKIKVDGSGLTKLRDGKKGGGGVLSNDGKLMYYYIGGEMRRVDMESFEDEKVGFIPGVIGGGVGSMSVGDDRYICGAELEDGTWGILDYHTDGSKSGILYKSPQVMIHVQFDLMDSEDIIFWTVEASGGKSERYNISHIKSDGSSPRVLYKNQLGAWSSGHFMWLGRTKEVISTLLPERWAIVKIGLDGNAYEVIAEGENFWHAASSFDGEWIVSDTLAPDTGLKLVNVKTGKFATICRSKSSNGKPDWTHPHPAFSPNGKMVVYNSDRTGIPHVYLVKIPEKLFEELSG